MPCRCSSRMMRASFQWRWRRGFSLFEVDAVFRATGLAGSAAGCSILAACVLIVSGLGASALGSTTAGRSIYFGAFAFGASAAGGTSAVFDPSAALAGAATVVVSLPSERLRSPACAAADAKTNPAIRMNLRMMNLPLRSTGRLRRADDLLCEMGHANARRERQA